MGRRYSDESFGAKHVVCLGKVANAVTADTALARFTGYMNCKVVEAFAVLHNGEGTDATSGWTVKKGTTSIGAITAGTGAVGAIVAAALTDTTLTAADTINIHNVRSDTNLQGFIYLVYQEIYS